MSFQAFGRSSGPTGPPDAKPVFGSPSLSTPTFPNTPVHSQFPTSRSFGAFEGGPTPRFSTPPFPNSSTPSHVQSPRNFGTYERAHSPLSFDDARLAGVLPRPSVAPIRAAPLRLADQQSSLGGDVGGPIQKLPSPFNPHALGTSFSSRTTHFQDMERTRSPPVQYTEDFLNPKNNGEERSAPLQLADKHNSLGVRPVGGPIQKFPPPFNPRALGTSLSSRTTHFQDMERTRSPPVQYTEDFLNPKNNGEERAAPLGWGDGKSSLSRDVGGSIQKRSPSGPRDFGTSTSSKAYRFQDVERTRSPPVQYNEDFLQPHRDGEEGASFSPPKSRTGTGVPGNPKFQNNQRSSLWMTGMNGGAFTKKVEGHSVSKRSRSPPATTGQVSLTNTYSEDDTERELQAKAKRLARFKTELDEAKPSASGQYGSNIAMKKASVMKDKSSMEKKKVPGEYPSRSMEDGSQDVDNEGLQSSSVIVGMCPDMCPESERGERERKGDLDRHERLDGDRNQTSKILAVKKYNRTSEREAELIRPMPILQKTMDYLLGLLDQPYDDRFLRLYNFLWDRMRAIRMDLRMQHIFNLDAIAMLEQMIRLHIVAMHELCEFSKGEGFSEGFDAHLNIEQMNKTSVELFQLYDDHRKRGILIPTEKEFRGYYALLKLDKHPGYKVEPAELSLDLAKMTAEIRQTHEVLFARDVARSCRTGNYIAFFRHLRKGNYLQACLMHAHFSKLRTQALASLHCGVLYNQGLPVSQAAYWLGMEGEDILSLLEYHGFSIKDFEEPYMVKEGLFLNADKDYPTLCSKLVHEKKSNAIIKDILSSHQVTPLSYEPSKEVQFDKNKKTKHSLVRPKQTETLILSKEVMDTQAIPSPSDSKEAQLAPVTSRSMQVKPLFEPPKIGQTSMENSRMASVSSPKSNIATPNAFASFQSHGMEEQLSPMTPRDNLIIVDETPLVSYFSLPQIPDAQTSYFGMTNETSYNGVARSPPGIIIHTERKALPPHIPASDEKFMSRASETDYGVASSLQDDAIVNVAREEFTDEPLEVKNVFYDASYYDKEVAEAKLKLLIRLWKRRSARKREYQEQNRLAAKAALSSLSLGPPVWQTKDNHMPYRKLNIDRTLNERHEKLQQSWARWNLSDLVVGKLGEKNANSNCICWKVISFSRFRVEGRNPVSLDQWLRYKLIPDQEDEIINDLVLSAPGLSIWSKWVANHSDVLTCCLSVVKDVESGNFERKLDGANAVLFPLSDTLPLDLQRVELHNLVMRLPAGAFLPLLILTSSSEEFHNNIINKLGLNGIDKSRVRSFMVISLKERESTNGLYGCFSDQKLKEGLLWLASHSHPQPVLYDVKMRELVLSHLNICSGALARTGSDKLGPNQCISAFNEALDRSSNKIGYAAKMNPSGWPCPEVFLLDKSTVEFRAVGILFPSLGWSSSEEVEPLISALMNSKLPTFSDDMSFLNRGCNNMQDFETQRKFLEDGLVKYLTQSGNVMNSMMATKEADVLLNKCTTLELHDTGYKLVPHWQLIFRRVFNWQLNRLSSIYGKAYVLEEPLPTSNSTVFKVSSDFMDHLSLDEMVKVGCIPVISKSSPESQQDMSVRSDYGVAMLDYIEEEQYSGPHVGIPPICDSDTQMVENDSQVLTKSEKESDRLSKLLEQCNALQDEIEKKLCIYF